MQGADGTQGDSGSDSGVFINKIVSCVLNKNLLPYTTNGVYFVLTSSEVQINGARCTFACAWCLIPGGQLFQCALIACACESPWCHACFGKYEQRAAHELTMD